MTGAAWLDGAGLVTLPSGARVRGRRLSDPARRIGWPDFWIPADRGDALDALHEAHNRAHAGERVEVTCHGGIGRTGTALAALAILDGLTPREALSWVRSNYHRRAVESPWQRRWLNNVC